MNKSFPGVAQDHHEGVQLRFSAIQDLSTELLPVNLGLQTRLGFEPHHGLIHHTSAYGGNVVFEDRFLALVSQPLEPFKEYFAIVIRVFLKNLIDERFEGIHFARPQGPFPPPWHTLEIVSHCTIRDIQYLGYLHLRVPLACRIERPTYDAPAPWGSPW